MLKNLIIPAGLALAAALAIAMATPSSKTTIKTANAAALKYNPANSTEALEKMEAEAFDLVNTHRKGMGLPPLTRLSAIDAQCRKHSLDMATGASTFSHDGAAGRLKLISKSMKSLQGGAENIFECDGGENDPALVALNQWLKSPGHRTNIEGDYNLAGMGVAQASNGDYYFTQIFVKGEK